MTNDLDNTLNITTIILLNLAEYHLILGKSAYGILGIRRYSMKFCRIIVRYMFEEVLLTFR